MPAPRPQRVAPGIHLIATFWANAYLIETGGSLTLIDCLMPGNAPRILRAVEAIGGSASALKAMGNNTACVWLTHADMDHIGSLANLKELTGASVAAHPLAEPFVRGQGKRTIRAGRLAQALLGRLFPADRLRPSQVDRFLEEGETIDGWQVIETPGHAPGYVAFYHAGQRALIAGDTLVNLRTLQPSTHMFTEDPTANAASIRRLAELDVEFAAFGHGPPIAHRAGERIKKVAQKV